mgnify:CR=1 FL=1
MEKFMEEYGGAVKVGAVLIGLTVLILFLLRIRINILNLHPVKIHRI